MNEFLDDVVHNLVRYYYYIGKKKKKKKKKIDWKHTWKGKV
jgi:hypothetical protein